MKVLVYTRDNPWTGRSGVAAYCRDLTPALAGHGIAVAHVFTDQRRWGVRNRIRQGTHANVPYFSIVNSSLRPAHSIERPWQDVSERGVDRTFSRVLARVKPDLVHFHTFVGLSASALRRCHDAGIPTVVTFHDFWTLCPRLTLVRLDGAPCPGPEEGLSCVRFCAHPLPWRRRVFRWLSETLPPGAPRAGLSSALGRYASGDPEGRAPWSAPHPPARSSASLLPRALAFAGRLHLFLKVAGDAGALLAVSQFVATVLAGHGLPEDRITVLPLGLRVREWVRHRPRSPAKPIRFGFLGRATPLKGAHILAQAARDFDPQEARFLFFGPAGKEIQGSLRALAGPRPALEFRGPYRREALDQVLSEVDVVVAPSLAQETVGLAALEGQAAGCPVIAARSGALPEWVRDGENGLLVPPGQPGALAAAMRQAVDHPEQVARWSQHTVVPPSVDEHAEQLMAIYRRVTGR